MNNNTKEARAQEIKNFVYGKATELARHRHARLFKTGFMLELEGIFETFLYDDLASSEDLKFVLGYINDRILECDKQVHSAERHGDNASTDEMAERGQEISAENTVESRLEAEEMKKALHNAIKQMPDKLDRYIAWLMLGDKKPSQDEIGKQLGISQETVSYRYRCKIKPFLLERMKDYH